MNLLRRDRPPAAALARLAKGERVVSFADTEDGSVVLATPLGLWWPAADGLRCIGWQYISKAAWQDGVLTIIEGEIQDAMIRDRPPVSLVLARPRDLPLVVRKRVNANIVKTELVSVPGGAVRFVGRRIPGADGVAWWARLERDTPDGEDVRRAVHARIAILRAQWEAANG